MKSEPRVERWVILEDDDGDQAFFVTATGHYASKGGNPVWLDYRGNVAWNKPGFPPFGLKIVKEGTANF